MDENETDNKAEIKRRTNRVDHWLASTVNGIRRNLGDDAMITIIANPHLADEEIAEMLDISPVVVGIARTIHAYKLL